MKFFMFLPTSLSYLGNMSLRALKFPVNFKGYKIGIAEREFVLQAGDVITVYGTLIYQRKTKTLVFEFPQYFMDNK